MKYSMAEASRTASLLRKMYSLRLAKEASAKTLSSSASLPPWIRGEDRQEGGTGRVKKYVSD